MPWKVRIDETGNTYGKLRVISFSGIKNGEAIWNCMCECGRSTKSYGCTLRRGAKSCGRCKRTEFIAKLNKTHDLQHVLYIKFGRR